MTKDELTNKIDWLLHRATYDEAGEWYAEFNRDYNEGRIERSYVSDLGRCDRFYLLVSILNIDKMMHPWLYARCREVENNPDGYIDLWAREHFKSTIITFGGTIQEIINDPEITIGIFSHNASHSRDNFILRLKREFEQNANLHTFYPDIFWKNPSKEAPVWSRDTGLILKRKSNPPEATVSGWGVVDSMPTGSHFGLLIFDDVVTERSVTTPEMIIKTTERWELATYLGQRREDGSPPRTWYIGTRYNYSDTYGTLLSRKVAIPRLYPATHNGLPDGKPVYLKVLEWEKKKKDTSPFTVACQLLQNPMAGEQQEFKPQWVRRWEIRPETLNVAICVDPASSKKKGSSNTAMVVIGIDAAHNKYLLDGACHKMTLSERWKMLKYLRFKWLKQPGIQAVVTGYEKYGMQSDIEHFKEMMRIENAAFPIEEVSWPRERTEGSKDDRIRRLIPDHQNWRFFYPWEPDPDKPDETDTPLQRDADAKGKGYLISKPIKRKNENGRIYNLVEYLLGNEYLFFPATTQKDMLDAMSRIYDLDFNPPQIVHEEDILPEYLGEA